MSIWKYKKRVKTTNFSQMLQKHQNFATYYLTILDDKNFNEIMYKTVTERG